MSIDIFPGIFLPFFDRVVDTLVQTVQLLKSDELLLNFREVGVILVGKTKEHLTLEVGIVLALAYLEFLGEHLESVYRLFGILGSLVGSFLFEVFVEFDHIFCEPTDVFDEDLLVLSLLLVERVPDLLRLDNKGVPVVHEFLEVLVLVLFKSALAWVLKLKELVHVLDWAELVLDV